MTDYKVYKRTPRQIKGITKTEFLAHERWCEEADQFNAALYQQKQEAYRLLLKTAMSIWGSKSRPYKYLKQQKVNSPPNNQRALAKTRQALAATITATDRREKARDYRQRKAEAVEWLEARGYIEHKDYPLGHAVSFRKQIEQREGHTPDIYGVWPIESLLKKQESEES